MSKLTDEQVVQDLVDIGRVSEIEQDIWLCMEGYIETEGFELNRKYGVGTRTLQRYARKVRIEMAKRRVEIASGRVRFGHTIAEGSRTRFASDGTPIGKTPGSSWNEDRLRVTFNGAERRVSKIVPTPKKQQNQK